MIKIAVQIDKNLRAFKSQFAYKNDDFANIYKNTKYNEFLAECYKTIADEKYKEKTGDHNYYYSKSKAIEFCGKSFSVNNYKKYSIKEIFKTMMCRDKFCNNCKNIKQNVMKARFEPALEKYDEYLYHMVLTVENPNGKELKAIIQKMQKKFHYLIRLLKSNTKVSFYDFSKHGYMGAFKSLEITVKNSDSYHPHFHVAIAFKHLNLKRKYKNKFSRKENYKTGKIATRKFSDLEVVIQKIWYLLMNDEKLTKENIEKSKGYSVIIDKMKKNDYNELFKYLTKGIKEDDNAMLDFEEFRVLYESLNGIRQLQGYGCFYNLKDSDITKEEMNEVVEVIDEFIKLLGKSEFSFESVSSLMRDTKNIIISRKRILNYLRDEKKAAIDADCEVNVKKIIDEIKELLKIDISQTSD